MDFEIHRMTENSVLCLCTPECAWPFHIGKGFMHVSHVPVSVCPVTFTCCLCSEMLKMIPAVCPAHSLISAFPFSLS